MKIVAQALLSAVVGLAFFGVLLFVPAGTLDYWQAWAFIVVFVVATMVPSVYLAVRDPAALARRLKAGPGAENRPLQKLIMSATIAVVVGVLIVSALDHRFGWSNVPTAVVILGDVMVVVGLGLAQFVVVQNSYAAATITVEPDQQLVTTGLYGVVRHPMYFGTAIMMVGTPLALDSFWGLLMILLALPVLVLRIVDEEALLRQALSGYVEYTQTVRYRLIPHVW
ncbi:isoprenylcysteine carboxylmethyltransferase family protein [Mycobacterium sp. B14F4]|uniref:methyltransferase family protein n=1 Tax=Mycobacterium sp. B14F4 TaxID=3153565 RepID=UPI00325CE711